MMINARFYAVLFLCGLMTSVCLAQSTASDSFESAAVGSLDKVASGEGFADAWKLIGVGVKDVTVVEKSLQYAQGDIKVDGGSKAVQYAASDAGIAVLATRGLEQQPDVVYLSVLFEASGSADSNDFFQIGFDDGKANAPLASVVCSGKFYARSGLASQGTPSMGAVKQGETALLVVKAEKINGSDQYNSVTIYANPISMEETANKSVKHDQNSGMKTIKRLSLRKAFTEKGDVFVVDAIRIGSTFESVLK